MKYADLKKGDKILFGKWSGTEVKLDGEDLLIMYTSNVQGAPTKPITSLL